MYFVIPSIYTTIMHAMVAKNKYYSALLVFTVVYLFAGTCIHKLFIQHLSKAIMLSGFSFVSGSGIAQHITTLGKTAGK